MLNRQVMVVAVAIGLALVVAPRLLVWARRSAAPQKLAPYVQTPQDVVERMLQIAQVGRNDVVYDLGCGDGRLVITAARKYGARGVGVDFDMNRVKESQANAEKAGVEALVEFRQQDALTVDVSPATVVTLYLLTSSNLQAAANPDQGTPAGRAHRVTPVRHGRLATRDAGDAHRGGRLAAHHLSLEGGRPGAAVMPPPRARQASRLISITPNCHKGVPSSDGLLSWLDSQLASEVRHDLGKRVRIDEVAAIAELEVAAPQLRRNVPGLGSGNVRVVGGVVDRDPLLMVTNQVPPPRRAVVAARGFSSVAQVGVAHAHQDRTEELMGLGVSHGGDRARGVPDEDRVLVGAQLLEEWQPEPGAGFDVVRKRLVDDRETECEAFALEPRVPDVASGTATVTVNQDDLHVRWMRHPPVSMAA